MHFETYAIHFVRAFRVMMKNLKKEAGRETRRTEFILEEGEEGVGLGSREG